MKKLTNKREKFIEEMLKNGGNQRAAYKVAYNAKNMSDATIDKRASELLKKGEVRGRYEELLQKARKASADKALMDVDKIIESYAIIATSDIGDYYSFSEMDLKGNLRPKVLDLSKIDTRAIKQIKTDPKTGKIIGILLHDKMAALNRLEEIFDVKGSRAIDDTGLTIRFKDDLEGAEL